MLKIMLGSLLFGLVLAQNEPSCPMGAQRCYNDNGSEGSNPCHEVESCQAYHNNQESCEYSYESHVNFRSADRYSNYPCVFEDGVCKASTETCSIKTSGTQNPF